MFTGFTQADFDAYAPKKWKSNVFTRERLEVKQKLVQLSRELAGTVSAADGSPLTAEFSVEYPALWNHKQVESQHLFFSRNEGARKELDAIIDRQKSLASMIDDPTPQRNHLFLAVTLSHEALEVSLRLHPDAKIDRQNLERKCEDHFEREKLIRMISALPDYQVGVTPQLGAASELDETRLSALVAELLKPAPPIGSPQHLLCVGHTIDRATSIAAGEGVLELAKNDMAALLPIYRFIAWSRDNDFVYMKEALQKEKQTKRQKGLAKHDQVRIVRGMFSGKSGVVQEIDAKGGLKVLIGKLAIKVDIEDVAKS